jgi:DNA-directed RNA polymerase sigma subunit (sigma70/sigma32)
VNTVEQDIRIEVRAVGPIRRLAPYEESELVERSRRNDPDATARLIQASMPLITSIAHEYKLSGIPLLDLISHGQLGAMTALKYFDPMRDDVFAAFAAPFIRRAIQEHLDRRVTILAARMHPVAPPQGDSRVPGVAFIAASGSGMLHPEIRPVAQIQSDSFFARTAHSKGI